MVNLAFRKSCAFVYANKIKHTQTIVDVHRADKTYSEWRLTYLPSFKPTLIHLGLCCESSHSQLTNYPGLSLIRRILSNRPKVLDKSHWYILLECSWVHEIHIFIYSLINHRVAWVPLSVALTISAMIFNSGAWWRSIFTSNIELFLCDSINTSPLSMR